RLVAKRQAAARRTRRESCRSTRLDLNPKDPPDPCSTHRWKIPRGFDTPSAARRDDRIGAARTIADAAGRSPSDRLQTHTEDSWRAQTVSWSARRQSLTRQL